MPRNGCIGSISKIKGQYHGLEMNSEPTVVPWCEQSKADTAVHKESVVWHIGTLLPSLLSAGEEQFCHQTSREIQKIKRTVEKKTSQEGKNCGPLPKADEDTVMISPNIKDATKVMNCCS